MLFACGRKFRRCNHSQVHGEQKSNRECESDFVPLSFPRCGGHATSRASRRPHGRVVQLTAGYVFAASRESGRRRAWSRVIRAIGIDIQMHHPSRCCLACKSRPSTHRAETQTAASQVHSWPFCRFSKLGHAPRAPKFSSDTAKSCRRHFATCVSDCRRPALTHHHRTIGAPMRYRQGQRSLSRLADENFEQEVFIPIATSSFHDRTDLRRILFEQRPCEAVEPGKVLSKSLVADA